MGKITRPLQMPDSLSRFVSAQRSDKICQGHLLYAHYQQGSSALLARAHLATSLGMTSHCFFGNAKIRYKRALGYSVKCSGDHHRFADLQDSDLKLYGCQDSVELMMIRGTGRVLSAEEESTLDSMFACDAHFSALIVDWEETSPAVKKHGTDPIFCQLPNALHVLQSSYPKGTRRLKKDQALKFIEATGILCHPGTATCTTHEKLIDESRFKDLLLGEEFDSSSSEDEGSQYDDNQSQSSSEEVINDGDNDKVGKSLKTLAKSFGLNRVATEGDWASLSPSTQVKKVLGVLKLFDGICKTVAGNHWEDLKEQCIARMKQPVLEDSTSKIMDAVGEALSETDSRDTRNRILSLVSGIFTERQIKQSTGCTSYDVRQAKLFAAGGQIEAVPVFRKRIDDSTHEEFVQFLASPDVVVCLPNPGRSFKLGNGDYVEIAKTARMYAFNEVYRMYIRSLEVQASSKGLQDSEWKKFVDDRSISLTTAIKIMKARNFSKYCNAVTPTRRERLQCIDQYRADAIEAYESLLATVIELSSSDWIDHKSTVDLKRRIRVSQNFISHELRLHMEYSSSTVNHCLQFALSDPAKPEFTKSCSSGRTAHSHDLVCNECEEASGIFSMVLNCLRATHSQLSADADTRRFRLSRMIEMTEQGRSSVEEFKKHQVRTRMSEIDRREIIDTLQPSDALIVWDFALKILPNKCIETQSAWYGKAGISYHMSYVVANIGGELKHHAFGHSADDFKQDSIAVSSIAEHLLSILKKQGIKRVVIRSDNAGCYRNAPLMCTLFELGQRIGIEIMAYVFSEAQSGKGDADREISHSKRKIRDHVRAGGNTTSASEIITALCAPTQLKASSFFELEVDADEISGSSFPGISSFGSFRFEKKGIRARKHDAIGNGVFFEKKEMEPNKYTYRIVKEGGTIVTQDHFWGDFGNEESKAKNTDGPGAVISPKTETDGIYTCKERLCNARFLTVAGLEKHELRNTHRKRKDTESLVDSSLRMFAKALESSDSAKKIVRTGDSLTDVNSSTDALPGMGWGLKGSDRAPSMTAEMKDEVTAYFHRQRSDGKRALAREIASQLREMKMSGEKYRFPLALCPKESQCQSLISTLLREEAVAKVMTTGKKNRKGKRRRAHSSEAESGQKADEKDPKEDASNKRVTRRAAKATAKQANEPLVDGRSRRTQKKRGCKDYVMLFNDDPVYEMLVSMNNNDDDE